jgi:hypothetical protein
MANGNGGNGTGVKWLVSTLVGTGIVGLIIAGAMSVAQDARIAISVAEQHGQELLLLRGEIISLRQEMQSRTRDRYTSDDADRDMEYIERRLNDIENDFDKCCRAPNGQD